MGNTMKTISKLAVGFSVGLLSFSVNAEIVKHTISAGYAHSNVEYLGYELDNDTDGFNLKYRMEFDREYGLILSYAKTDYDDSGSYDDVDIDASLKYSSFMIGPTFRANEYFSAYLLIGRADGELKASLSSLGSVSDNESSIAYGGGLQIDVTPNFVIDGSYEYTKLNEVEVGTWVIGAGFSF